MKHLHSCMLLSLSMLYVYVSLSQLAYAAEVFDSCTSYSDCEGGTSCYYINNNGLTRTCYEDNNCFCLGDGTCTDSNECQIGEVCAKFFPTATYYYCIPCAAFSKTRFDPAQVDTLTVCPAGTTDSNGGLPSPRPVPSTGAVFDSCTTYSDCEGGTSCYYINNNGLTRTCYEDNNCFCLGDGTCTDSNECQIGEVCAKFFPTATFNYCIPCTAVSNTRFTPVQVDDLVVCSADAAATPTSSLGTPSVSISPESSAVPTPGGSSSVEMTVSPSTTLSQEPTEQSTGTTSSAETTRPTKSPTGTSGSIPTVGPTRSSRPNTRTPNPTTTPTANFPSVCIAINSLESFASEDLIYKEHFRASVLCDKAGNCATPGHIVLHQGRLMMMKTYCAAVEGGCERAVRFVNSPRMKQQLRVPSKSDHLVFTALSARFETKVEEIVISALIRVGI